MGTVGNMKIAVLCHPTIGGSGILATMLGYELAERGHHVTFISTKTPFRLIESHANIRFDEVKPVDFPLFQHPDSSLPLINHLLNTAGNGSFDIVHAHYAIPNAAAAVIAKALMPESRFRIVTTLHGTDVVKLGQSHEYSSLIEQALMGSDAVTCVSENLKSLTQQTFPCIRSIDVIPNYYRRRRCLKSRAEVRKDLGVGETDKLLIHLSNLRKVKRIDLLLETFSEALAHSVVPLKLLILGGADFFKDYEEKVESFGLSRHLIFCRDVIHVQDYIEASDIGIFCSEYESFCLGILECMAHGIPVVAFAVGGIPEVLQQGRDGLLCAFGDTVGLARDVVQLAQNDALRLQMGKTASVVAEEKFSPEAAVDQYEALYRRFV